MLQLEDTKDKLTRIFPVQRWIRVEKHYNIYELDAFLPQHSRQPEPRKLELAHKRKLYEYKATIKNGPQQVANFSLIDVSVLIIFFSLRINRLALCLMMKRSLSTIW
jgi:hypothetical protein